MSASFVGVSTGIVMGKGLKDIAATPVGVVTRLRFTHRHPDLIDQARSDLGATS